MGFNLYLNKEKGLKIKLNKRYTKIQRVFYLSRVLRKKDKNLTFDLAVTIHVHLHSQMHVFDLREGRPVRKPSKSSRFGRF